MTKKQVNTNDFNKVSEKRTGQKPITDINYEKERVKRVHNPNTAKQSNLVSAFDVPRDHVPPPKEDEYTASPVKGKYKT